MDEVKRTTKRYSPTRVTRIPHLGAEVAPSKIVYEDATVQTIDRGRHGESAMLRIYTDDENAEEARRDDDGYVRDADGDIDLERVIMVVTKHASYGHGNETWSGFVGFSHEAPYGSGMRVVNRWDGFGDDGWRFEEWHVRLTQEEEEK